MKTFPVPVPAPHLDSLKKAYDSLMLDDLPIDFDKVSALIQAAGCVVRVVERDAAKPARMKRVTVNGTRYIKAA